MLSFPSILLRLAPGEGRKFVGQFPSVATNANFFLEIVPNEWCLSARIVV
jgi:hypothetical protein